MCQGKQHGKRRAEIFAAAGWNAWNPRSLMRDPRFTLSEKAVFVYLVDMLMDHDTCYPSYSTIARETTQSVSAVRRAVQALAAAGLIAFESGGPKRSNTYRPFPYVPPEHSQREHGQGERCGVVSKNTTCGQGERQTIPIEPNPIEKHHGDGAVSLGEKNGQGKLPNIELADLKSPERLAALHQELCARGLADDSEFWQQRIWALAARALRVGTKNPCGLFAAIFRRGDWRKLAEMDFDAGNGRIKQHCRGQQPRTREAV